MMRGTRLRRSFFAAGELVAQRAGEAGDLFACQLWIDEDERSNIVERVEGEMRADMAEQTLQLRLLERQPQIVLVASRFG